MIFRKTTEVDLAGKNFVITHWSPTKVMSNLPKLGRYIAVPMATITGSMIKGGEGLEEAMPTAILFAIEQLEQDDINKLINLILEDTLVNGVEKVDVDEVFADDVMALIELITTVLKVNYGCFFKKGGFESLRKMLTQFGLISQVDHLGKETTPEAETPTE